jgi:hypothetical protein
MKRCVVAGSEGIKQGMIMAALYGLPFYLKMNLLGSDPQITLIKVKLESANGD